MFWNAIYGEHLEKWMFKIMRIDICIGVSCINNNVKIGNMENTAHYNFFKKSTYKHDS